MFKGWLEYFWRLFLSFVFGFFGFLKFFDFTFFDKAFNTIFYHLNLDKIIDFHQFLTFLGGFEIFFGIIFLWRPGSLKVLLTNILIFYLILTSFPVVFNFSDHSVSFMSQFDDFWEKFFYVLQNVVTSVLGIFLIMEKNDKGND